MNKDLFWEQVVQDVKEESSQDDADALRMPENLDRWRECLIQFKKDLERQAASRKATFHKIRSEAWGKEEQTYNTYDVDMAFAEYYKWKSSIQPILKSLESRIREVKYLRQQANKQKNKGFHKMWRLINMAEALIPSDHAWHEELKELR